MKGRIDDRHRAMNGIELAVRRVADRMKMQTPQDPLLIEAFDQLADEINAISSGAESHLTEVAQEPDHKNGTAQESFERLTSDAARLHGLGLQWSNKP